MIIYRLNIETKQILNGQKLCHTLLTEYGYYMHNLCANVIYTFLYIITMLDYIDDRIYNGENSV